MLRRLEGRDAGDRWAQPVFSRLGRWYLAHRRLSLLAYRRKALRTGGRDGLGLQVLVRRLPRTALRLGRPLGKGRRRAGAHVRRDRMNPCRVDRLDLHAPGGRGLAGGLDPPGPQLRRRQPGPRILLQHLLLRGKRNRRRRWSEFGDYGTIRKNGRGRSGPTAIAVRKNALPLWC